MRDHPPKDLATFHRHTPEATAMTQRADDGLDGEYANRLIRAVTAPRKSYYLDAVARTEPWRAIAQWEADEFAQQLVGPDKGHDTALHTILEQCWTRLPNAPTPEVALTFERLIRAFSQIIAWTEWATGQSLILDLRIAAENVKRTEAEDRALARWSRPKDQPPSNISSSNSET